MDIKKLHLYPIAGVILIGFFASVFFLRQPPKQVATAIDVHQTADDCINDEIYDEEEQLCYMPILCKEEITCQKLENEYFQDLQNYKVTYKGGGHLHIFREKESEVLVTYKIADDKLAEPTYNYFSGDHLENYRDDTEKHEQLYIYIKNILPVDYRKLIGELTIFTDGQNGRLANVSQIIGNPYKWRLQIDITDAYTDGKFDQKQLGYSLVHEFGHLASLNNRQVTVDEYMFSKRPRITSKDQYIDSRDACLPRYFAMVGCSKEKSYLNDFYKRFWTQYDKDVLDNIGETEPSFYSDNPNDFITVYAATNPMEDLAESWTAFVLNPKPDGEDMVKQKIKFFYEYPELVKLRKFMRTRMLDLSEL